MVRDAEEQAQAAQAETNAAQNDLLVRAALGDLLLRLDSGAAYDDLLEAETWHECCAARNGTSGALCR